MKPTTIYKYDLSGKYVCSYTSLHKVASDINRCRANIRKAIRRKGVCAGFYFSEIKVSKYPVPKNGKKSTKEFYKPKKIEKQIPITLINNSVAKSFESIYQAAKFINVAPTRIGAALKRKGSVAKWKVVKG